MREAGIGNVRMDFLWSDLEPTGGQFSFERYEQLIDILRAFNLNILGVLHYNPDWRGTPWNAAPDPASYLRYAKHVVKHFSPQVHDWEIWNEPDHPVYWQPQDQLTTYSALLKRVTPELKSISSKIRVLMGGLSAPMPDHLRALYHNAGKEAFDIVNIHPFTSPFISNPIGVLQNTYAGVMTVMREFGDQEKPIWFTEIGCPGVSAEKMDTKPCWLCPNPTEEKQAEWLVSLYENALGWPNVERIFWAFFRDTDDHFHDATDYLGLLRHDLSPKPAYHAYRSVVRKFQ